MGKLTYGGIPFAIEHHKPIGPDQVEPTATSFGAEKETKVAFGTGSIEGIN